VGDLMNGLPTIVIHGHSAVQALILKILAQAGITSAIAMASLESALAQMNRVTVGLLLLDVQACRTEGHLATAVADVRERDGTRLGLMASHRDRAMPPIPHDFVLRKPFGSADLWAALGQAGDMGSWLCEAFPTELVGTAYRYGGPDDDWRPMEGVPIQEALILRDRLGGTCLARFESVLAYRVMEGQLKGAPTGWRWADDKGMHVDHNSEMLK
jgi:hypothetical protein